MAGKWQPSSEVNMEKEVFNLRRWQSSDIFPRLYSIFLSQKKYSFKKKKEKKRKENIEIIVNWVAVLKM